MKGYDVEQKVAEWKMNILCLIFWQMKDRTELTYDEMDV